MPVATNAVLQRRGANVALFEHRDLIDGTPDDAMQASLSELRVAQRRLRIAFRLAAGDLRQLRKAVNQILPLISERDPGAKDCLKDQQNSAMNWEEVL